jgi:hypothetical protein
VAAVRNCGTDILKANEKRILRGGKVSGDKTDNRWRRMLASLSGLYSQETSVPTEKASISKSNIILVTGRGSLQDCGTSAIPYFLDNPFTDGGQIVSLMRRTCSLPPPPPPTGLFLVLISVRG